MTISRQLRHLRARCNAAKRRVFPKTSPESSSNTTSTQPQSFIELNSFWGPVGLAVGLLIALLLVAVAALFPVVTVAKWCLVIAWIDGAFVLWWICRHIGNRKTGLLVFWVVWIGFSCALWLLWNKRASGLVPESSTVSADTVRYIWIPSGNFVMGCSPNDNQCLVRELPQHQVTVKSFCIGETEVTQAAYERIMGFNPSKHRDYKNWPVDSVTPAQAEEFCRRAIEGGRLPTEEEWEYAARAGTSGPRYGEPTAVSWTRDNSARDSVDKPHPHAVRISKPNAYGLYDMLGNVWEWTSGQMPGFNNNLSPVARGGSWYDESYWARASARSYGSWSEPNDIVGFRCVRDAESADLCKPK